MIQFVLVFVLCASLLLLSSGLEDVRLGGKVQKVRRHRQKNELFGEDAAGPSILRKQFKNGVVGSVEEAEASLGGDVDADDKMGAVKQVFRRGFHKASYLLGNITAQVNEYGRGRGRRKEVTVVHPETGVKTAYDLTNQKTDFEAEDLTMHMCNEPGEAYSASWLTTKQHVLEVESEKYNLTWVNCEMASFIHMRRSMKHFTDRDNDGMIMQALDVLDFSVIHLSAFERSSKRYTKLLKRPGQKFHFADIPAVAEAGKQLEREINPKTSGKPIVWSPEARRTVAVMPFLGGAMGSGHSELGNRFVYLHACFWSIYQFIPNIVAGVTRQADVDWIMRDSGLPFHDVVLLDSLPKSAGLPVGLTQVVKQRLSPGGAWEDKFDYVYFTESDQILIWRTMHHMYDHLKKFPRRMLLPHRLMPYSTRVITEVHQKTPLNDTHSWQHMSCCLPRQNCDNRLSWVHIKDPQVEMINYLGLHVPLGNVDFLLERFRSCKMIPHMLEA